MPVRKRIFSAKFEQEVGALYIIRPMESAVWRIATVRPHTNVIKEQTP